MFSKAAPQKHLFQLLLTMQGTNFLHVILLSQLENNFVKMNL